MVGWSGGRWYVSLGIISSKVSIQKKYTRRGGRSGGYCQRRGGSFSPFAV